MPRAPVARYVAVAATLVFCAFVAAKGIPTLRHDWNWPVDRGAIGSFFDEAIGGWVPLGFGAINAHPTTYLIALPLALIMWIVGPLAALMLLAAAAGYTCFRCAENLSLRWGAPAPAAVAIGLFALFNPWVYNEVVAGHLAMVLAYGGILGLIAEMLLGAQASPVRLALWLAVIALQLQFFLVAGLALVIFAFATKKWLAPIAGAVVALPSAIGLIVERSTILQTPYSIVWQTNQSVDPAALTALGGYFPGYADRLGLAASISVWIILALAIAGAIAARRRRAAIVASATAFAVYLVITGVHGPLGGAYAWAVREIPETGVFRELYDLAGIFAALLAVLACAAMAALPFLRYPALVAGIALPVTWLLAPPSGFWIGSAAYSHPNVSAPVMTRVVLLPAFQPLGLRSGGGDGADPDAHAFADGVTPLNEYFPTYPVDMALARYERERDVAALRALGVTGIVARPWLVSRSNGQIGLAAPSLAPLRQRPSAGAIASDERAMPLISTCAPLAIVALGNNLSACSVFVGDAAGARSTITPLQSRSDSLDPRNEWIDARLGFTAVPALAQGIGGVLTQSALPYRIEPGRALLAYVRGRLNGPDGRTLVRSPGGFSWTSIPENVDAVVCRGLCELVAQAGSVPQLPLNVSSTRNESLQFRAVLPWFFIVRGGNASAPRVMRLNERYDGAWIAISRWRLLPHLRIDMAANGWLLPQASQSAVVLVQVTSLLQMIAEICAAVCILWLLKAAMRAPTKRV